MTDSRRALLTVAHAYSEGTGRSLARLATIIHNQGAFFKNIEAGASCTIDTYDKAMQWFSDYWPDDLSWPEGVIRPLRSGPLEAA